MGGTYNMHGRDEECTNISVEKSERKRPLGRARHRWKYIKITLKKQGGKDVYWIQMAQYVIQ
jgi:hypothetical protein